MAAGSQSHTREGSGREQTDQPEITVCESAPGRSVFLESGNTDGWIASDTTLEVWR
ncbi:hypothetical protein ACFQMA_07490 [Halosimplex aquaticum]|uniref:Uncharacterized protein n=1 Tax=Halosimplex aquaticum TaxID=3026162 RepID=A0ABD5XYG2_9EURY|nr:hypothetical protein [Halosimplex aquaticum]